MEQTFLNRIESHQGILHKVARLYVSEEAEREDLVQEMVFQLWKAYPRFDEAYRFSTWMYRVALNTAITYLRKRNRRPAFQPLSPQNPALASEPGKDAEVQELYRAIDQLSPVNKALVLLHLEEKSHQEIADILVLSANSVGVRLHRIRKQLKTLLTNSSHESR